MIKDNIWTLIIAVLYLGILMALVRPSSKGPMIINNILSAFADLVGGVTGVGQQKTTGV